MENFKAALNKLRENRLRRERRAGELRRFFTDRARLEGTTFDVGDRVRDKETGTDGRIVKTAFRSVLLPAPPEERG